MSIEEIIERLDKMAQHHEICGQTFALDFPREKYQAWGQTLREAIALLRTHQDAQPNEPLTLEELRGMHGKPGWLDCKYEKGWGIIGVYEFGRMISITTLNDTYFIYTNGEYNDLLGAKLYRRPPKEESV